MATTSNAEIGRKAARPKGLSAAREVLQNLSVRPEFSELLRNWIGYSPPTTRPRELLE
jgi:hypothetical protein